MTLTSALVKSTVVAALGGLLFGFDTAVIAGTTAALSRFYALTSAGLGLTVVDRLVGTVIGALAPAFPVTDYGRRDSLRMMATFTWFPPWVARWPSIGRHWSFFDSSAGWGLADPLFWARCISPRLRPRVARTSGRFFPIQCGVGNFARLSFQLPIGSRVGRDRVAMEIGCGGRSRGTVSS